MASIVEQENQMPTSYIYKSLIFKGNIRPTGAFISHAARSEFLTNYGS